jgi:hypothetical protein
MHKKQLAVPAEVAYVPGEQGSQAVTLPLLLLPAGQALQVPAAVAA